MSETETNGQNLPAVVETAVPQRDPRAGTAALAEMSQAEFEVRLAALRRGRERVEQIHRELMRPEADYGVIPGTPKPTLLKPGAEKLCDFYRLAAEFHPRISYGEGICTPPIMIITECRLHLGSLDGPVVNTGHGAANSWEKRYRYRRGERACPSCGKAGTIIKGKAEYGGGYICFGKKGGCGAKWPENAPEIANQPVGDVENPDPFELLNTLLKMAEKRAYVDATLRATATSGLYTQDIEEMDLAGSKPALESPKADPEEIVVCSAPECGAVLNRDEIIAAGRYFGGTPLCTEHGKRRRAAEKAEREANARVEAAEAAAAEDPFEADAGAG